MTDTKPVIPSDCPAIIRVATTPVIYSQGDLPLSPALSNPPSVYPYSTPKRPDPTPNDAQSPYPRQRAPLSQFHPSSAPSTKMIFIQRRQTSNQPNNHRTIQPSLFAFRQESLKGSRILRIPSEISGISRVPSNQGIPSFLNLPTLTRGNTNQKLPSLQNIPSCKKETSALRIPTDNNDDTLGTQQGQIHHIEEEIEENAPEHLQGVNVSPFAGAVVHGNVIADMSVNPPPENNGDAVLQIEEENQQEADQDVQAEAGRQGEESIHDEGISKAATKRVLAQFIFNLVLALWYVLGYLLIKDVIPVVVLFVVFIALAIAYIGVLFWFKGFFSDSDFLSIGISVLNIAAFVLYAIIGYLQTEGSDVPLAPFTIFGFVMVFGTCFQNSVQRPSPSRILIILERIVIWIQLLIIALKVDGLDVPWGTVFIPLYFALVVFAFSSLLVIFGAVFAFVGIMREEGISLKLVSGSIWYLLNALYTPVWLFMLTEIIKLLENDDNRIDAAFITGFIHSGILFGFTLLLWKPLKRFQMFEIQSEMLQVQTTGAAAGAFAASNQPRNVNFKVSKENKANLVMISPTFYTFITKHIKSKEDKQPEKTKKEEEEKVQNDRIRNTLAMGATRYRSADPFSVNNKKMTSVDIQNIKNRNLDMSEGHIHIERQVERQLPAPPAMKKGESNRSNNENLCAICFDHIPNAVLMDCGHGGICYECALENWKKTDNCLMCRQPIKKILKIVHFKPLNIIKVVESTTKVLD